MRQNPGSIDPSFASDLQPGNDAASSGNPAAADPKAKAKAAAKGASKAKAKVKGEYGESTETGTVPKAKTAAQEAKSVLWFKKMY